MPIATCKIVEMDLAGVEAVVLGWCMQDKDYVRLGKLGMHAYVASHVLERPASLAWPDEQLSGYLSELKKSKDATTSRTYQGCKKVVHGNGYGQTPMGILLNNPSIFRSLKEAEHINDVYYAQAPSLPKFHMAVRNTAHETHFLGGSETYKYEPDRRWVSGHPYAYKHWFWSVVSYERLNESQRLWRVKRKLPVVDFNGIYYAIKLGEDGKRVCAYYPQSISRGILTESAMTLFADRDSPHYIGDVYFGRTPLRAPIHDSFLMEVPSRKLDKVLEACTAVMTAPVRALPCPADWGIGNFLTIGVDGKVGLDWDAMEGVKLPQVDHTAELGLSVAGDMDSTLDETEDDESEWQDLIVEFGETVQ